MEALLSRSSDPIVLQIGRSALIHVMGGHFGHQHWFGGRSSGR
jgi:hypothetical protein